MQYQKIVWNSASKHNVLTVKLYFGFTIITLDAIKLISPQQRDKHRTNADTHDDWDSNPEKRD